MNHARISHSLPLYWFIHVCLSAHTSECYEYHNSMVQYKASSWPDYAWSQSTMHIKALVLAPFDWISTPKANMCIIGLDLVYDYCSLSIQLSISVSILPFCLFVWSFLIRWYYWIWLKLLVLKDSNKLVVPCIIEIEVYRELDLRHPWWIPELFSHLNPFHLQDSLQ